MTEALIILQALGLNEQDLYPNLKGYSPKSLPLR